jgi:hypothetical protein
VPYSSNVSSSRCRYVVILLFSLLLAVAAPASAELWLFDWGTSSGWNLMSSPAPAATRCTYGRHVLNSYTGVSSGLRAFHKGAYLARKSNVFGGFCTTSNTPVDQIGTSFNYYMYVFNGTQWVACPEQGSVLQNPATDFNTDFGQYKSAIPGPCGSFSNVWYWSCVLWYYWYDFPGIGDLQNGFTSPNGSFSTGGSTITYGGGY